jgi:hypothetical protein
MNIYRSSSNGYPQYLPWIHISYAYKLRCILSACTTQLLSHLLVALRSALPRLFRRPRTDGAAHVLHHFIRSTRVRLSHDPSVAVWRRGARMRGGRVRAPEVGRVAVGARWGRLATAALLGGFCELIRCLSPRLLVRCSGLLGWKHGGRRRHFCDCRCRLGGRY